MTKDDWADMARNDYAPHPLTALDHVLIWAGLTIVSLVTCGICVAVYWWIAR